MGAIVAVVHELAGRVVDRQTSSRPRAGGLEAKLKAHEDKTSDQIVVATVRSLEGYEVEDYANRLLRNWKLGRTDKNNGALLLVAPRSARCASRSATGSRAR